MRNAIRCGAHAMVALKKGFKMIEDFADEDNKKISDRSYSEHAYFADEIACK